MDMGENFPNLRPVLRSSTFGFASDVTYAGYEERGMGQLRHMSQGCRKLFVAHPRL